MDKDQFWHIIDDSRVKADRWQNMYEPLHTALTGLDAPDIIHWQQIYIEYHALSYKQKLWAAAATMLGGCSDDSFEYFRGWLIAQGKEVFVNALADPESLAKVETVKAFGRETCGSFYMPLEGFYHNARFEAMNNVAADAYKAKTGADLYGVIRAHPLSKQERVGIANDIVYAEGMDTKWGALNASWIETDAELMKMFPRLHALFNSDAERESVIDKIRQSKNTPDVQHPKPKQNNRKKDGPEL